MGAIDQVDEPHELGVMGRDDFYVVGVDHLKTQQFNERSQFHYIKMNPGIILVLGLQPFDAGKACVYVIIYLAGVVHDWPF